MARAGSRNRVIKIRISKNSTFTSQSSQEARQIIRESVTSQLIN
jgi:hypothetical protein